LFADSIKASSLNRLHQQAGQKTAPDQCHCVNLALATREPSTEDVRRRRRHVRSVATTTIDGKQLPPPQPNFGDAIHGRRGDDATEGARRSKTLVVGHDEHNTLGAPFGGTTRGAHQAVDSEAFSLITPHRENPGHP
jgi:hypothetical protein